MLELIKLIKPSPIDIPTGQCRRSLTKALFPGYYRLCQVDNTISPRPYHCKASSIRFKLNRKTDLYETYSGCTCWGGLQGICYFSARLFKLCFTCSSVLLYLSTMGSSGANLRFTQLDWSAVCRA